ncbi:hypothetical protein KI387_041356 [Taxus chinensis]|uniref:HP domain-containing protein n=3 Tax=Taxus chinensis TaxID=29808 RepID=A0AA38C4I8_TAXCH|nr:hypothetical protein KI387_041356 [Taxus chinensis]
MDIWRIENFQPVSLPKSDYGKFYSGDSYVVLQTSSGKSGTYQYDIHFWLGKDTSQDEAGTAAIKTVELDAALGGRAVQYRELQGHESDKFLSYFKPCILPLEGGVASGFKKPEEIKFETCLYVCKGRRVVRMKQVPFARTSLNHDDVFLLDTESKIYQFNGTNSNIQERAKALEVVQYLKDKYHEGKCEVAIIDDGKLQAEADSGEFWGLFGGFAPIGKKSGSEDDSHMEITPGRMYSIVDGQLKSIAGPLSRGMLESNKCYLLDCGAEIYVWVGRVTQLEERKAASSAAEEFISSQKRSKYTSIIRVIQGFETQPFKSKFDSWPLTGGNSGAEDGRGKVAALLKQQGVDVKGMMKATPAKEEIPPLLEGGGKLEVWRVNNNSKAPVRKEEIGKFYGGDCYIILYTYHSGERKEGYYLCFWLGQESTPEDQITAARLTNTMANSLKGKPVQGRILQGKEPAEFIGLFTNILVLKGGLSAGYKKFISDKGLNDDTYNGDCVALIQVSGSGPHNSKAVQVDPVGTSLCSTSCFLLQSGSSFFTWHGNSSTLEQQQLAARIAEFLKPGVSLKHAKEGTEPAGFWYALGGKQRYVSKKAVQETAKDPHLYVCTYEKGKLEVTEVFNFTQDDLLTEDIIVLDTHAEIFVWVGQHVDAKEKQLAFEIGKKYMDRAALLEGLSPDIPLYKVTEGNEPSFFTKYFAWDSSKAAVQGNSFEKKLATLQGIPIQAVENLKKRVSTADAGSENETSFSDSANGSKQSGQTQRASALAALNSAFNSSSGSKPAPRSAKTFSTSTQSSQRAAALAALSTALDAEAKTGSPVKSNAVNDNKLSAEAVSETTDNKSNATASSEAEEWLSKQDESTTQEESSSETNGEEVSETKAVEVEQEENGSSGTYSYERLKAKATNPARGIDHKKRETYLSPEEFEKIFGMDQKTFYEQPKWKQDMRKKAVDLF